MGVVWLYGMWCGFYVFLCLVCIFIVWCVVQHVEEDALFLISIGSTGVSALCSELVVVEAPCLCWFILSAIIVVVVLVGSFFCRKFP